MTRVTRACLCILLVSLVGGCNSLLGIGQPHAAEDAGVGSDGGSAQLLTLTGMTSVGPDGSGTGGYRILDPRFEGIAVACSNGYCLAGGLTP